MPSDPAGAGLVVRGTHCVRVLGLIVLAVTAWVRAASANDVESTLAQIRQLTFEGKRAGEGYFSADGTRMIFQSEREPGNPFYQIYLMDLETGDTRRVSTGHGKTTCGWIHPSGRAVLYASTHEDPETEAVTQVERDFRASGKQRRYAWDYDPWFDIYVQDLDSGMLRNLTRTRGYDAEGAWSPDGSRIVFASNRRAYSGDMSTEEAAVFEHDKSYLMDLYLMDASGGPARRLTTAPGYDGGPFFSADGQSITWRRFSRDGASAEIYAMDLATGDERQLTRLGAMSWAPYFHPSGDYLIFTTNREGFANFELYLVDAQGRKEPVRVTYREGFDGLPTFSPDGRRLSWTSNATADRTSQIFVADWDDPAARRLLGLASAEGVAADATGPATVEAIRADDARVHVVHLTADAMEGRLTGSRGARAAEDYVATVFDGLGLKPGGDGGSWFQAFPFAAGIRLGPGNRLEWTRGTQGMVAEVDEDWRPLAISRTGAQAAAGVVFAGYGLVAPGADSVPDYDSYGDLDVTGKWVLVLRFLPESVPAAWKRHLIHYSDLAYKAAVAKRKGAAGLLVVTGPMATARDRLVTLRLDAVSADAGIAAAALSDAVGEALIGAAGRNLAKLQSRLDEGEAVPGFAVPDVTLAADIDVVRERGTGRNVIARLEAGNSGAAPVIIGAHLDHLGRGQVSGSLAREDERGAIHPGADDNASGVAGLLEVAQYLSDLERRGELGARRPIVFAAWSGEELGTLGSGHFVEALADGGSLDGRVAAYLNMDMIGHLGEHVYLQGVGSSGVWAGEIERRNVPVGLPVATHPDPYLPTDTTPFYMKGVPVLNAFTGAHENYSTPRDTADTLDYQGIEDIARLMAGITRSLARRDAAPEYRPVVRKSGGLSRRHLRAYLGTIPAYGQREGTRGVRLQGAVKDGPADRAGVQGGDVIVGLAGVEVETIQDFMGALSGLTVGEVTELVVLRDGRRISLSVMPGARE